MKKFSSLKPFEQKVIINSLLFDAATFDDIEAAHGIESKEIANFLNDKAVKPYNDLIAVDEKTDEKLQHKKTIFKLLGISVLVSTFFFFCIFILQTLTAGFTEQNITDSLLLAGKPLLKCLYFSICLGLMTLFIYLFFPIVGIFLNEQINTVSLKSTFLEAKSESKLDFVSKLILALCILLGLVFSDAAAQNCVVTTAKKEIGVLEIQGKNNQGKRINDYVSLSLNKKVTNNTEAWCGYFVDFVLKSCGKKTVDFGGRASNWFTDPSKIIYRRNFQYGLVKPKILPGDIAGYMFKTGRIGHVGIIEKKVDNEVFTIEGNTGNSQLVQRDANKTDGVKYKKRNFSQIYIIARI